MDFQIQNFDRIKTRSNKLQSQSIFETRLYIDVDKLKDTKDEELFNLIIEMNFHKDYSHLRYNEREALGYIGIVNEGMTCYMNSMLQTLNILGSFKKAIFKVPTAVKNYDNICLSLQRTFYDLIYERNPIRTDKLTESFGWSQDEVNVQHDVQEFNLKLSDALETELRGTVSEGFFASMFQGKTINYIECLNVNCKSSREENFCDLSLTVKVIDIIYKYYRTVIIFIKVLISIQKKRLWTVIISMKQMVLESKTQRKA